MVPTEALPPAMPFTSQITLVSLVFASVAVKVSVPPPDLHTGRFGTDSDDHRPCARSTTQLGRGGWALLTSVVGVTITLAESLRAALSVTVKRTVATPQLGVVTLALALLTLVKVTDAPLTALH